jgi:uncharacterized RDD family membrane protein YckC
MEHPRFPERRTHHSVRRYVAHLMDGTIYTICVLVGTGALVGVASIVSSALADAVLVLGIVVYFSVGQVAYYTLTQRRTGRSPGKQATRLRVVTAEGLIPPRGALVRRSIPLMFEWIYLPAWISMMASPYRQRLGDRWAHTYVVRDDSFDR